LIAALQFNAKRPSIIADLFASTTESNRSYHEQLYYSTLRLFVATNAVFGGGGGFSWLIQVGGGGISTMSVDNFHGNRSTQIS
jgi:hypothetical protein